MDKGKNLVAPQYAELVGPAVFLAGPIQGGTDWQAEAIVIINDLDPLLNVCSPRRDLVSGDFTDELHAEQVDWETHYLRRCGANGVVLFWLTAEAAAVPGRTYAQTTRFELGEWKEKAARGDILLVVGIEDGFSNARYIRRRFTQDCPEVPLLSSLKETCAAAVRLARRPGGSNF